VRACMHACVWWQSNNHMGMCSTSIPRIFDSVSSMHTAMHTNGIVTGSLLLTLMTRWPGYQRVIPGFDLDQIKLRLVLKSTFWVLITSTSAEHELIARYLKYQSAGMISHKFADGSKTWYVGTVQLQCWYIRFALFHEVRQHSCLSDKNGLWFFYSFYFIETCCFPLSILFSVHAFIHHIVDHKYTIIKEKKPIREKYIAFPLISFSMSVTCFHMQMWMLACTLLQTECCKGNEFNCINL